MSGISNKDAGQKELVVGDLLRQLLGLAEIQSDVRTGNKEIADSLRLVAQALKSYRSRPLRSLPDLLANFPPPKSARPRQRRTVVELPANLEALTGSEVDLILADGRHLKSQLADLGFERFGISRAKLGRLNKVDAIDAVRAALEHERSLEAISEQAQAAGHKRAGLQ